MEQHPVPQNVTTFQFRLIGDMTIKQFGYLAGGMIVGYICYKLPLPFFFTWPLAITTSLLGFGLAFVPVEERPMDIWIASFFRNIYNPTQWVWSREAKTESGPAKHAAHELSVSVAQASRSRRATLFEQFSELVQAWLRPSPSTTGGKSAPAKPVENGPLPPQVAARTMPHTETPKVAARDTRDSASRHGQWSILEWFGSLFRVPSAKAPTLAPGFSFTDALGSHNHPPMAGAHLPSSATTVQKVPVPQQPINPPAPVSTPVSTAPAPPPPASDGHKHIASLQGQLTDAMRERERLENELIALRQKMDRQAHAPSAGPVRQASTTPVTQQSGPTVRVIAPGAAVRAGIPQLTTFPNVVTGIVKDQYGNLLSGMLITVRDRDDVPLRALKTNRLGQFAASTPLPNNTYMVEIEDPKGGFLFDKAQIQLSGAVIAPLEITAKSQKQVERDRLAKEIFGNQL